MGQLCDGSHGSWVTKDDLFPSLRGQETEPVAYPGIGLGDGGVSSPSKTEVALPKNSPFKANSVTTHFKRLTHLNI